uniref:Bifunctional coenzyme A synthase n=1 Tax=Cyprinus carpio carpio TaxID=630221 RepID=A0A9J8CJ93_CYPCA
MSMFSTGILVLTSPLHVLPLRIAPVLTSAAQVVERTLYVHLHPGLNLGTGGQVRPAYIPPVVDLCALISRLYSNAADICAHLDVRVLLSNVRAQSVALSGNNGPFPTPQTLSHSPEVVLTDFPIQDSGQSSLVTQCLQKYTGHCYVCKPSLSSVLLYPRLKEVEEDDDRRGAQLKPLETFSDVVVGGTFDRLHGAHKTLLNISCLMANRRFVIGVCDQELLKNKVLKELIEPYDQRVQKLQDFLNDVKPSLKYEIVPLSDPFGPSISDPELQCIVVSEETRKGGEAVNRKRVENPQPALPLDPYVIGLTGGSGSGKSSIAHRLEALGAVRIDCDQLGHEAYLPGTSAYHKILQEFGPDILNEDKSINRRVLGGKVFGNQERLKALTDIVWPEIALLVKKRIEQAKEQGKRVCVVDAAVLLEAGWTYLVHEVWVATIPEEEAVKRIVQRDGVKEEDALRRLKSQWLNAKLIEHANVVLCTLWEPDVTQRQVLKAWTLLQQRIQKRQETTRSSL